jgi:hypothetical protein
MPFIATKTGNRVNINATRRRHMTLKSHCILQMNGAMMQTGNNDEPLPEVLAALSDKLAGIVEQATMLAMEDDPMLADRMRMAFRAANRVYMAPDAAADTIFNACHADLIAILYYAVNLLAGYRCERGAELLGLQGKTFGKRM